MTDLGTFWFDFALIAGVLAMWFCISDAMCEAVIGTIAQLSFGAIVPEYSTPNSTCIPRKDVSIGSVASSFHSSFRGWAIISGWRAMELLGRRLGEREGVLMTHARVRWPRIESVAIATASSAPRSPLRASPRLQGGGCF